MPNLTYSVTFPILDRDRYLRDFRKGIRQAIILAAQAFLKSAIPQIPVWTGMASGALENLEILAGITVGRNPVKATHGYYYYPGRLPRTPELGQSMATPPNEILSGDLVTADTGTQLHVKFEVDIEYFNYLDENVWRAFDLGEEAFNYTLQQELARQLPNIQDYFVVRRIV
jgi:hypothetical protein